MGDPEILVAETTPTIRGYLQDARGKTYPLSGATVSIIFKRPDGVTLTRTATITSVAEGIAEYVVQAADIPATSLGVWQRQWRVDNGPITHRSAARSFQLVERL